MRFGLALLGLLLLPACTASRPLVEEDDTLADVNAALYETRAFVHLASGRVLEDVWDVQVARDTTTYWTSRPTSGRPHPSPLYRDAPGVQKRVPTDSIAYIETTVSTPAPWVGLGIGATPGLLLVGAGATADCEGNMGCGIAAALSLFYGGIAAGIGGLTGAILGNVADDDRRLVYRAPVERYLACEAEEGAP